MFCFFIILKAVLLFLKCPPMQLYSRVVHMKVCGEGLPGHGASCTNTMTPTVPTQAWGGHLFLFPPVKANQTKNIAATWLSENRDPGTPNHLHTVTTNPAGRVHTGKGLRRQWTDATESGKVLCRKELSQFHQLFLFIITIHLCGTFL